MVTIINAAAYSINKGTENAYEITYSEGTKVRAVEGKGVIRREYVKDGVWVAAGKAYVVNRNNRRGAERIVTTVEEWLAAARA